MKRKRPRGRVQFYRDRKGEFRWRIRASSGKILADCGEGYKRLGGCKKGLVAVYAVLQAIAHAEGKP